MKRVSKFWEAVERMSEEHRKLPAERRALSGVHKAQIRPFHPTCCSGVKYVMSQGKTEFWECVDCGKIKTHIAFPGRPVELTSTQTGDEKNNTMKKVSTFYGYQRDAKSTAQYPENQGLVYTALGLAGEAGEYADKIKKVIRDHQGDVSPEMTEALLQELGDVLWYVTMCARELGSSLNIVANKNLEKLFSRHVRGVIGGSGDDR